MKEMDRLINEIANSLMIHPDMINLSRVSGGFQADVNMSGKVIASDSKKDPVSAMNDLLKKCHNHKAS